jgi:SAM-dependent methyltransferase
MASEFTGERVIPGRVDVDLWNEHLARYLFAARLARRKRVLDIGCGAGYGSFELARTAAAVTAIDVSPDALEHAAKHFSAPNIEFREASATQLPLPDASFDLIIAFEVIEHLDNWPDLLKEARRLLAPGGQFVVSTPNKLYYEESRRLAGPNPFHTHEFEFAEFQSALADAFPHQVLFTQNHSGAIIFQPAVPANSPSLETRLDAAVPDPAQAHFYLAVCALQPLTGAPAFIYIPSAANVLRERELHIQRLESELATKNDWLAASRREHSELVDLHTRQTGELKQRNLWAQQLNEQLEAAGARVIALQEELAAEQAAARQTVEGYEKELSRLESEKQAAAQWGMDLQRQLAAREAEFQSCLDLLHQAEATVEERSQWALNLDKEIQNLRAQIEALKESRWLKLGRRIGIGPQIE